MKKETTYRLTRDDLRKLGGHDQTQTRKETTPLTILDTLFRWRKLGIIIAAGTAIAVAGELGGFASKPEVAPAPVAVVAPAVATTPAEPALTSQQLAECRAEDVVEENCERYHEALAYANELDADKAAGRESYADFRARQQQRQDDLAYCAKNRGDWSCSEGQYAGQY